MSYSSVVLLDSPFVYYRLGEASGTSAGDNTGTGHTGTYTGGFTLGAAGAIPSDTDTAAALNGSTGYVQLPTSVTPATWTTFSVEAWIKLANTTFSGNPRIASNAQTDADHTGFQFFVTAGAVGLTFAIGNGTTATTATCAKPLGTTWHHVVATYDSSNIRLYVDGNLVSTTPSTLVIAAAAQGISLGRGVPYNGDFFPGSMDEIAIYHSTLSLTQIRNHIAAATVTTSATVTETSASSESVRAVIVTLLKILETSASSESVLVTNTIAYVVERSSSSGSAQVQSIIVSAADAQMQYSDLKMQYARIRLSAMNRYVRILATTTYSSPQGELDALLYGESISQLHVMRSINAVTAFLENYSYQSIVLSDQPEAYYRLGESSGTSAADATMKYGTGTISGGVTLGVAGGITGNPDTAVSFNGTGTITLPAALNTAGWTGLSLECWIKAAAAPASYTRIIASDSPNSSHLGIELLLAPPGDGRLGYFNIGEGGSGGDGTGFGTTIVPGTWYHIAAIYGVLNGVGVVQVYVNGNQAGGYTTHIAPIAATLNNLALGYNPAYSGDFYNGSLDEVAIYSYPLAPDRILQHYNVGRGVI